MKTYRISPLPLHIIHGWLKPGLEKLKRIEDLPRLLLAEDEESVVAVTKKI